MERKQWIRDNWFIALSVGAAVAVLFFLFQHEMAEQQQVIDQRAGVQMGK
ncbi:MAG: hypothetical protein AB7G28_22805 [Pirellulales bacterium]